MDMGRCFLIMNSMVTQVIIDQSDLVGRVIIPMSHGDQIRSVNFWSIPIILFVFLYNLVARFSENRPDQHSRKISDQMIRNGRIRRVPGIFGNKTLPESAEPQHPRFHGRSGLISITGTHRIISEPNGATNRIQPLTTKQIRPKPAACN